MQQYEIENLPQNFIQKELKQSQQSTNNYQNNDLDSSNNHSQVEAFQMQYSSADKINNKYGNLKVLFENDRLLFTIGPDYCCFIVGYLGFFMLGIFMISVVYTATDLWYFNLINIIVFIVQCFSYLFIALSNPGIQTRQTIPTDQDINEEVKRYCKKCSIRMQKGTVHCRSCNVCIRQYDHHCPWVSKCIGQNNLKKFYFFVGYTTFYLIYSLIVLLGCMTKTALQTNEKAKTLLL